MLTTASSEARGGEREGLGGARASFKPLALASHNPNPFRTAKNRPLPLTHAQPGEELAHLWRQPLALQGVVGAALKGGSSEVERLGVACP